MYTISWPFPARRSLHRLMNAEDASAWLPISRWETTSREGKPSLQPRPRQHDKSRPINLLFV
ncbi:hypothetical protein BC938DRAFT_480082 [Jimgerdemannia flammicorona]|uniref:Uncharacterized protein n=1 Tax=Jimgerdemannia flammicorona TaxID=994334 RepID=A0A433QJF2_9FUNG|nr:hypothetical protein BC938DRAFT_480082 [Jimgerdemannia flammicorona]